MQRLRGKGFLPVPFHPGLHGSDEFDVVFTVIGLHSTEHGVHEGTQSGGILDDPATDGIVAVPNETCAGVGCARDSPQSLPAWHSEPLPAVERSARTYAEAGEHR